MDFEITDVEMTINQESIDRIREVSEGIMNWEGNIETENGDKFRFEFERSWGEDNGGQSARILAKKPKTYSDEEWDNLEQEMIEFIEEEYRKNRRDWEEL